VGANGIQDRPLSMDVEHPTRRGFTNALIERPETPGIARGGRRNAGCGDRSQGNGSVPLGWSTHQRILPSRIDKYLPHQ
jgi:hypothetical protein